VTLSQARSHRGQLGGIPLSTEKVLQLVRVFDHPPPLEKFLAMPLR